MCTYYLTPVYPQAGEKFRVDARRSRLAVGRPLGGFPSPLVAATHTHARISSGVHTPMVLPLQPI